MKKEESLSDKIKFNHKTTNLDVLLIKDVKEAVKRDTEFLDINKQLIGFQLSDVVVTAINLMFKNRSHKIFGDKLVGDSD